MSVTPARALQDVPVSVAIRGLPAADQVTVESTATDDYGVRWSAQARFAVPADGTLSLSAPSLSGSYTGSNPMGLFEFMAPATGHPAESVFISSYPGYSIKLTASVDGVVKARADCYRIDPYTAVRARALRPASDGVYGELYLPRAQSKPAPAVLVFGGSEGGLSGATLLAVQLAAHGYPALALAYFDEPGLPKTLSNIPLEYFARALRILRTQPGVDARHVLVKGASRGSEAALLLGADFPDLVDGVIAASPSSVANPSYPGGRGAAWTLHGKPVPTVARGDYLDPASVEVPAAVIPVEKIRGPILLACGGEDQVWISCAYSAAIVQRLHARHFRHPVTLLRYPDAGHYVDSMTAYYSATQQAFAAGGGTLAGNQTALAAAHAALLHLLATLPP